MDAPSAPPAPLPAPPPARTGDVRLLALVAAALLARAAWREHVRERDGPSPPPVRAYAVDVNRAPLAELGALPGVGPSLAARIAAARGAAPFRRAEDLDRVPGIGPAGVARIAPHVRFDPPDGAGPGNR